ncbi:MAG: sensor histidine kinase [Acidobacteriota bacterium]|nr:sensor histidine kinase [Acidobacteriota bacterium]
MITWQGLRQLDRQRPWLLDAALALALLAVSLSIEAMSSPSVSPLHVVLSVITATGYAARRAFPLPAFFVTGTVVLTMILLGFGTAVIGAGMFLMAYSVAVNRTARATIAAACFAAAVLLVAAAVVPERMTLGELATNLALFAGSFALGRSVRINRAAAQLAAEHSALAEQVQREQARATITEERLRIARELHDVVGHSLGVIALQAGVGARVVDTDPVEAKAALDAIAERSRTSLREVRQILGVLRDPGTAASQSPGLASVPNLVADLAKVGLQVELEQQGEPWPLSPARDLTAYRLLQESLTNVVRHAGTDRASLRISYAPAVVELRVLDRGRGPAQGSTPGSGLRGMAERVAALGGVVNAGAAEGGGFEVVARLPRQEDE